MRSVMNLGNSFLKTLKRVGYHEADYLDDTDFDSVVSQKELKCFFEVFCTFDESNVLTTEEIEEYSSLTPAELAEIERLERNERFVNNDISYEKQKECRFLQEHLAHIENHNKSIKKQIENFKRHEDDLLEEKETQQDLLLKAKKRFQSYEINKVAQAEEEFVSNLKYFVDIAQDLEALIVHSDANDSKLPTSNFFKGIVQQYLDAEEKVLLCLNAYILKMFQLQEDYSLTFIAEENSHLKELMKEASFLRKILKNSFNEKVSNEKELQKLQKVVKYIEAFDSNCHSSQQRCKLEDALRLNERLKKKEGELEAFVHDATAKYVDACIAELELCITNETCSNIQLYIQTMSLPMTALLHQRARIEILIFLLSEHKEELQNLKKLIQKVLSQYKQEQADLKDRKIMIENTMADVTQNEDEQNLDAILSSLFKILAVSEENDTKVFVEDVIQKANQFFEAKENVKKKYEANISTIVSVEKYAQSMESLLSCPNKEYSDWHELEQTMNINLNNLNIKLASLKENIADCTQDSEQKQKLLERKRNLRLARNLYVYALMNTDLFKKYINSIKVAVENSAD